MKNERELSTIALTMFALNFSIILFYSLICVATTFRLCQSFSAYDFLSSVRQVPRYPWQMPVQSLSLYALLCAVSILKNRRPTERFPLRVAICVAEIALCMGVIVSLDFYYSGIALLVLADLVHYVRNSKMRLCFIVVLSLLFAFGRYEIVAHSTGRIAFTAYLSYYDQTAQSWFTGLESLMVSFNILLFVLFMILLLTGQKKENARIRRLNEQLNQANDKLRDYAVNMERMTEIRERNRLAREIHDTLGHTLTGIIMGADAALALLPVAPEESQKRIQVIAQSAREGLTDVRRSIKALRVDALEQHTWSEAVAELVDKFRMSTGVEIEYQQLAGPLDMASDEEDFLYRVVQESMTNSVRHGHANKIEITIIRQGDILTVDVQDDGDGSDQVEEGFGLRHMRERLELLGGVMTCGNRGTDGEGKSQGFFVTVNMPVRKREG